MTLDAQALLQLLFGAVLLPLAAGGWLSRRTARAIAALIVAALGGVAGAVLGGLEIALAAFAWAGAMAYFGAAPGLLPGSLEEAGRLVKESPRRWWR